MSISIPADYGLVAAALFGMTLTNLILGVRVGLARKRLGVALPALYACKTKTTSQEQADEFNCLQRGHQNMIETLPNAVGMLLIAGLHDPKNSAILGGLYCLGRVLYAIGYSHSPNARTTRGGFLALVGYYGLAFLTARFAYAHQTVI